MFVDSLLSGQIHTTVMTSNSKRKEEKDCGMEADLSPFKRLRINVPATQISQERMSKYKKEAVKNLRKQGQLKLSIYMNSGMLTVNEVIDVDLVIYPRSPNLTWSVVSGVRNKSLHDSERLPVFVVQQKSS
ncbi:uncharacterized protein LOC106879317 [Octopus bimaculoides]|uniref:uncharacterized protein LOC106879317 n=1 Tax=Octopus bimaculoides TaxID=37653 RepID=UPI00071D577C|nr:uncharacterized protein LOC106879317 [Octopus bimaculoides]|eukprot:XP_014784310.1 PREDICTED: uncharacterized protein LOC106879317 [Octopus bimaculoides]